MAQKLDLGDLDQTSLVVSKDGPSEQMDQSPPRPTNLVSYLGLNASSYGPVGLTKPAENPTYTQSFGVHSLTLSSPTKPTPTKCRWKRLARNLVHFLLSQLTLKKRRGSDVSNTLSSFLARKFRKTNEVADAPFPISIHVVVVVQPRRNQ